jgi:hypothetical protein
MHKPFWFDEPPECVADTLDQIFGRCPRRGAERHLPDLPQSLKRGRVRDLHGCLLSRQGR